MIVASLAYDELSPDLRAKWVAVLRTHPDFIKWQQAAPKDTPNFDFGRYLFMRASTWPDDIRKSGSSYDHPVWHYIDYPLMPPDFAMAPAPAGTEDILSAIALCEKTLADPAAAPVDRAASVSWLIHLVGDVQQPLHCCELIDSTYPPPDGDRGGNLFFISLAGNPVNLHFLWDSLPGSLMDAHELIERAAQLKEKFPRTSLPELKQARDPKMWSLEGRALAIDAVYHRGTLPGGKTPDIALPPLPAGYMEASRALADRRLTLAGYRLADELAKAGGGNGNVTSP